MNRIKTVLATAATLVIGGLAITQAIDQARQEATPAMRCSEYNTLLAIADDPADHDTYFLGIAGTYQIPKAVDGTPYGFEPRLIGDCAAGVCTIASAQCAGVARWRYVASAPVNARRLVAARCSRYTAGALRILAAADPQVHWLGSFAEAVDACLAKLPAADCRTMFADIWKCWRKTDGTLCRYGRLFGPGAGGTATCTLVATDKPYPCETSRGAGAEVEEATRIVTDEELRAASPAATAATIKK